MATPQGYGQLNSIKDPATRQLVQTLFDLVGNLQTQLTALQQTTVQRTGAEVPANGRVTGVSDPQGNTDAVNVQSMRKYVSGQLGAFTQPPP